MEILTELTPPVGDLTVYCLNEEECQLSYLVEKNECGPERRGSANLMLSLSLMLFLLFSGGKGTER